VLPESCPACPFYQPEEFDRCLALPEGLFSALGPVCPLDRSPENGAGRGEDGFHLPQPLEAGPAKRIGGPVSAERKETNPAAAFSWELEDPSRPLSLEPRPRGEWILSWHKPQKRYYLTGPEARDLVRGLARTMDPSPQASSATSGRNPSRPGEAGSETLYRIGGRFVYRDGEEFILSLISPDRAVLVSLADGMPWDYACPVRPLKKGSESFLRAGDLAKVAYGCQAEFVPGPGASLKAAPRPPEAAEEDDA